MVPGAPGLAGAQPASGGVQRRQGQVPWEQLPSTLTRAMQGQHRGAEEHLDAAVAKLLDALCQGGMLALRGVQVGQDDNRQLHTDRLAEEPERECVRAAGRPLVDRVEGGRGDDDGVWGRQQVWLAGQLVVVAYSRRLARSGSSSSPPPTSTKTPCAGATQPATSPTPAKIDQLAKDGRPLGDSVWGLANQTRTRLIPNAEQRLAALTDTPDHIRVHQNRWAFETSQQVATDPDYRYPTRCLGAQAAHQPIPPEPWARPHDSEEAPTLSDRTLKDLEAENSPVGFVRTQAITHRAHLALERADRHRPTCQPRDDAPRLRPHRGRGDRQEPDRER
jgi:hypothetical protein